MAESDNQDEASVKQEPSDAHAKHLLFTMDDESLTVEDLIRSVEEFVEQDVRDIEALILPSEDLDMFPDPQITSSDPNERRVARRLRIRNKFREKRKEEELKYKKEAGEEDNAEDKYDPDDVIENQIESSTVRLLELIQDGRELISNVKVAAVSYEVKRRDKVRHERAERREKLEAAAEEARLKFMEISNQWAGIKAFKDPLDINSATAQQREKCMEVIAKKDSIINDLKKELEEADSNFVRDLERQEEEINILVDRINQQINIMRSAANSELDLLEAAIAVEREEMMKANETEWEEMIDKKEYIESETNVMRNEIMDKHEKSIDAMETEQREQLKIKRTEQTKIIHDMQLQLQEIEALCLFNSEKLNHNYRVLKKRADENQIIKSQQKRTITKLQDVLSNLRKKVAKKESDLDSENRRMTNELLTINRTIRDMERRATQAASLNNTKFLSLWDFNQSQAQRLIQQIAYSDKIMYEQFLDIPAPLIEPPSIRMEDLPSFKRTQAGNQEEKGAVEKDDGGGTAERKLDSELEQRSALRSILLSVSKYASFLIEENVKDVINNFAPVDQVIVRIDKILTTVGVKAEEEIKALVKHFLPFMVCRTCLDVQLDLDPELEEEQVLEDTARINQQLYEDCREQIIEEVIRRLRGNEDVETADYGKDVMEAISSCVKDRISVIDMVVSQQLGEAADLAQAQAQAQVAHQPTPPPYQAQRRLTTELNEVLYGLQVQSAKTTIDSTDNCYVNPEGRLPLNECLKRNHEITIDRLLLVQALCDYSKEISDRKQEKENESLSSMIAERWDTESRRLSNKDVESFWKCFDVVSKEKELLWDAFVQGLKDYHKELSERSRLNEEITKLKRNNDDLMRLLQKYLSINTDEAAEMDFPKIKQLFPLAEELS